jgi:hypothetical protein
MVIGRPWEDPEQRPLVEIDLAGGPPAPGDDDGDDRGDENVEAGAADEELRVGPAGIDDPDTEWEFEDAADPLPALSEDEIWLIVPGEPLQVVTNLPKPRNLPVGLAIRTGEIAVCVGRRREWCRTPVGASEEDAALPMAHKVRVVFIRHRASGVRTRPRKYVIVTDAEDTSLGWLDYSDAWNFEGQILRQMVDAAGLEYEVERYQTESEFESAHPDWVD